MTRKKRKIEAVFLEKRKRKDVSYFKPERYRHYLTITELADEVKRDTSWIRILEKRGVIPKARRVRRGELEIRLYSPEQVLEIKEILSLQKVGRPRNDS